MSTSLSPWVTLEQPLQGLLQTFHRNSSMDYKRCLQSSSGLHGFLQRFQQKTLEGYNIEFFQGFYYKLLHEVFERFFQEFFKEYLLEIIYVKKFYR